jgi:hypothetical protein
MQKQIKIAVGYKAGSGKDTFCDYLLQKLKKTSCKIGFANPIYDILFYTQRKCNFPTEKDRQFLQMIGDWGRSKNKNIWIELALEKSKGYELVLLSDLRFVNEFYSLKNNGWFNVKIINDNISSSRIGNGSNNHSSETELEIIHDASWDYIIYNNGNIQEFYEKIDKMLIEKFNIFL